MESTVAAKSSVQWETLFARATEWRFPAGAATGWHTHGFDYAVVPMTNGILFVEGKGGGVKRELTAGKSYSGLRGTEHNVMNVGEGEVVFVEIEMLRG